MKKILAVLIAALMICLSVVSAMAAGVASGGFDSLGLVQYAIKTFGEASSRIHEAYADTIQKAMDYRKYYNEQGLAKAYDKMQVSMRNTGTPSYKSVLNTTNNTFYDMSRDYTYTYNTAYYNNTYNSYYIPVTYNDVDYNYFITYSPTYTNITYIVDGCNDPSQAVSNNYYFQLPDGRNSYNLTADDVFGIPLVGEVINYDATPENDNCFALYHFDGNVTDASGNAGTPSFTVGSVPQYTSHSGYGQCLTFSSEGNLSIPVSASDAYTVEFSMNLGQYVTFAGRDSFNLVSQENSTTNSPILFGPGSNVLCSNDSAIKPNANSVFFYSADRKEYNHDSSLILLSSGVNSRFGLLYFTANKICYPGFVSTKYYAQASYTDSSYLSGVYKEVARSTLYTTNGASVDSVINNFVSSVAKSASQLLFSFDYSRNGEHRNNILGIPQGQWLKCAYVFDGTNGNFYINGVRSELAQRCFMSTGDLDSITLHGCDGFSYVMYDELRISKGALYTENYTPASAPFDIPMALTLPSEKTEGAIAVKSAVTVNNVRLGGVRPSYPAQGDVYISLDADKKVTSCQQYQSGTWTECQGSVCDNDTWVDLSEYSFAGQVVNEDDFAEVIDKKEDPAAGIDANPEAEATSFTVHYYKEGTTDKVRRDTVYQNLAVGAAFTVSAPAVKGYKALAASAEITVTADGEHIFYYSVDGSTDPGGDDDDPSKPGFFDGLLSSVKSLVNVICGFVGGVVQSLLSGITGIISTLIDAFKAVLSLGGHFGDFLAAALGFVPREIIDLLIAGIAVSIALAIIKFIRG